MRELKRIVLVSLLVMVLLQSCFTKPDFPFQPEISFSEIKQISIPDGTGGTIVDSLWISINFKDGNGDLGLDAKDTLVPFNQFEADSSINPNYYNYFIQLEQKKSGKYEPFQLPNNATLNGRFPRILEEGKKNPTEGIITLQLVPLLSEFEVNDTIRFSIFIKDRALNQSNTIVTDSVVINRGL